MAKEDNHTNNGQPGKLESPAQLNDYVRVTSVSPMLIGCTILLLLCAFVVWGVFGTVTERVQYSGLIFPHHGTDDVTMDSQGTITKMYVHTGDTVAVGQVIAFRRDEGCLYARRPEGHRRLIRNAGVPNQAHPHFVDEYV